MLSLKKYGTVYFTWNNVIFLNVYEVAQREKWFSYPNFHSDAWMTLFDDQN